jgi:pimeloyl-ACP methyl ester carboxylesterase
LVFLHEGLGSIEQWKQFPEQLSAKLNLPALLYDRYGYGNSEKFSEERNENYFLSEAKMFLPEILDKLNIHEKVILFGHSDGATLALLFASYFPERTLAVVAEAPHVFNEDISVEGVRLAKHLYVSDETFKQKLSKYHGDKTDSVFYGWADVWLSPSAKDWNIIPQLNNITAPVLIIQGVNDEYGSYKQLETIRKNLKGKYDELYIENCGHAPHLKFTDLVINKITNFISKI